MGQAIGQVIAFAVGVALSPVPIIAVVLMLATPKGRVNGPAFLGELHDWMARENATIMGVICLIIGAKLIGDAITALAR